MNTYELVQYYVNLLILEYHGKPKAAETIATQVAPVIMPQTTTEDIVFSPVPDTGTFVLSYNENATTTLNWNDSAGTIEAALQALPGLSTVTVSGSIASGTLTVTFTGVYPPAMLLEVDSNTLTSSGDDVAITVTETNVTLPIAVQNGFNLFGDNLAVGAQLDILGKYVGVTRTSMGFTTQITLNDSDFRSLIQIATFQNNAGSSTETIVGLLNDFFPQQIYLFDRQTMEFDYYLSTLVGTMDLVQVFIMEGMLPKPMGVRIRLIIYAPVLDMFFGFRSYEAIAYNATPFNDYDDYHLDWPWLDYADAIIVP